MLISTMRFSLPTKEVLIIVKVSPPLKQHR